MRSLSESSAPTPLSRDVKRLNITQSVAPAAIPPTSGTPLPLRNFRFADPSNVSIGLHADDRSAAAAAPFPVAVFSLLAPMTLNWTRSLNPRWFCSALMRSPSCPSGAAILDGGTGPSTAVTLVPVPDGCSSAEAAANELLADPLPTAPHSFRPPTPDDVVGRLVWYQVCCWWW